MLLEFYDNTENILIIYFSIECMQMLYVYGHVMNKNKDDLKVKPKFCLFHNLFIIRDEKYKCNSLFRKKTLILLF